MPAACNRPALNQKGGAIFADPRRSGIVLGAGIALTAAAATMNYALARKAERRNPPTGKFIWIDRVRLHYTDRGDGPAVILLHGNGMMARDFELSGLTDLLATDYRVIAFDRPGFGYSDRPRRRIWTAAAQAALLWQALWGIGVRRAIIVGHSWGALVALAMALRNPTQTAALALLSGYYYPSIRRDALTMFWPAIPVVGDLMRYTVSPLLGRAMAPTLFRTMFDPADVPARFAAGFPLDMAVRPWQIRAAAAEAALMIPEAARLARHYKTLSLPLAIVAGLQDRVVDFDRQPRRLSDELPKSILTPIHGAGHMVHHTAPEQVANTIRGFERQQG